MTLMQEIKHWIIPGVTLWDSHWITNIFSSVTAVIIAWLIIKFRDRKNARLHVEISNKEKLKKELEKTLSILDAALDSTIDGLLVVDKEGKRIFRYNKKFMELFKIPDSIAETKDDSVLLNYVIAQLEDPDSFISRVKELYAHPELESYDEIRFKDGRIYDRYSKPQSIGNNIIGRVWSFVDVTEKRKAEERVKLFEHLVASVNESINIADLDDNILYVNRAFCEAYGYKKEEVIGKHISIVWSREHKEEHELEVIPDTLRSGWSGDLFNKRKDGSEFPIHLSTSVIRDHNNNPIAFVGVSRDMSKIKQEEMIRNAEYKISQAVQATEGLKELFIKIHSIVKDLMPLNNFYVALYDEQTSEITYPYFIDYVNSQSEPGKPAKGCTEYVLRKGAAELIKKDRFIELATSGEMDLRGIPAAVWLGIPLKVFNNIIGVMVVQDYENVDAYGKTEKEILMMVSDQIASAIFKRRTEYQLMAYAVELQSMNDLLTESENRLKELNTSKDKFFSIISHDLKGPYQGLLSMLDLLIREYDNLEEDEKKDIFLKIRNNSQRTYNLLDNLLQWSRLQTGKMNFEPERINLLKVSTSIIDLLFEYANIKKITIKNLIVENSQIIADQNMIQLIIRNLLSNAIKFSNHGSEILISAVEIDSRWDISVKDFGIGISKTRAESLFKIDVQSSTMGTDRETGTGLGLLLCKDMVTLHKGEIRLESEEGKGSTFIFSIPKA